MSDEKDEGFKEINVTEELTFSQPIIDFKLIEITEEQQWRDHLLNQPVSLWYLIQLLKKLDLIDSEITEDQIIEMLD